MPTSNPGRVARCLSVLTAAGFSLLVIASPALAQDAGRVRVLVVADTDAPGAAQIGLGLDGDNVKRVFEEVFGRGGKGDHCTVELFTGDKVSPLNILNHYDNLKTAATETLVFYYTGHGIAVPNKGHLITTHRGVLPRKILLEAMLRRGTKLTVVLTDCCANYGNPNQPFNPFVKSGHLPALTLFRGQVPPTSVEERIRPKGIDKHAASNPLAVQPAAPKPDQPKPATPKPATPATPDLVGNLFLQHKGLVDMNAAEMGKSASGNASLGGSYFTLALVKQLRKSIKDFDRNDDKFAEWREFFAHLDRSTVEEAQRAGFFQRPEAFSFGEVVKN